MTTKTVALVDVLGQLIDFILLPGQAHALKAVEVLIEGVPFEAFIANKVCDADWLVDKLLELNLEMKVVIPSNSNRKTRRDYDIKMYKLRRRVEKFFGKVKEKGGLRRDTTRPTAATRPAYLKTVVVPVLHGSCRDLDASRPR